MFQRANERVLHDVFRISGAAGHPIREAPKELAVIGVLVRDRQRLERAISGHEATIACCAPTAGSPERITT
jgi:hypothetical protein